MLLSTVYLYWGFLSTPIRRVVCVVEFPMGLLTSLPLPVVPRFRPTDMGLVDVERQEIVSAWAEWGSRGIWVAGS